MLRHTLSMELRTLTPAPTLLSAADASFPDSEALTLRHPEGHVGRFRIAVSRGVLELAGEITEPAGWSFPDAEIHPEWYFRDHVLLYLDPAHDHTTQRMVAVLRSGKAQMTARWLLVGEEATDEMSCPIPLPPLEPEVRVAETGNGWRVRMRLRLARLAGPAPARDPGAPVGIQLRWSVAAPVLHEAVSWPPPLPFWGCTPFAFADLAIADSPLTVDSLDFGAPVWQTGHVSSSIRIRGRRSGRAPSRGRCRVAVTDTAGETTERVHPWRAAGRILRLRVPVDYPFSSKWAPDIRKIARVAIRLEDARGRALWSTSYPFGFDAGILVREPFGRWPLRARAARRPAPADPAFVDKFRAWLLARLPSWQWTTTRDGAPSDFFLKGRAASENLDLMSPTIFADLARLIRARFPDWQDGLCAAAMALHHPCLTAHSSAWSRISNVADTGTLLRLGGCFCSDTARLGARLAEELAPLYRVPLHGFSLGLRGHLTTLVETPIGDVLIDPMLGIYYHTLDNTRLATLDEMRGDRRITARMWALARGRGGEFFFGVRNQTKRPWREGALAYPPYP